MSKVAVKSVEKGVSKKIGRKPASKIKAVHRSGLKVPSLGLSAKTARSKIKTARKPMTAEEKRDKARAYYVKNRAKILKDAKRYYHANKNHILLRIYKWRVKTKNGAKPLYAQGKASGRAPIFPRLPRLNGTDKGRDLTTGKKVVTTQQGRATLRKKEEKYDRAKEEKKVGKVPTTIKAVVRAKKVISKAPAVTIKKAAAIIKRAPMS